ncbi:hypothetical protein [Gordonia tangerina]|uniref:Scaffolding protein n=1 Tax=Gordonia tangerina TaxID=2911060 RepID=A0ABS9DQ45_9ACTN|nr:hypothetical protein [Gordonia tangerina]MCF3941327.1 hypothetical protein [Gordonia tangerina]
MSENAAVTETEPQTTTVPKPSDVAAAAPKPPEPEPTQEPEAKQWDQLPDDHPLVKTLAAQKDTIRDLKGKAARFDEIEAQRQRDEQTWQERAERAEAAIAERDKQKARDDLAKEVVKGTGFAVELLDGLDTEDAMRSRVELLKELKGTTPTAAPASVVGNADTTPANQVTQLTQADLKTMSPAQIRDADAKGQLDELKGIRK